MRSFYQKYIAVASPNKWWWRRQFIQANFSECYCNVSSSRKVLLFSLASDISSYSRAALCRKYWINVFTYIIRTTATVHVVFTIIIFTKLKTLAKHFPGCRILLCQCASLLKKKCAIYVLFKTRIYSSVLCFFFINIKFLTI